MTTAIEFNNISKQYRLGVVSTKTLSHDLNRWWQTAVLRREDPYLKIGSENDRSKSADSDYVWALKDIDFKVEQGDVVGIIGRNGAGKSTLLKLLSRVTGPTTGTIKARGRIGSLLEVGTGFHQEMTGRENIYMNGAILGMTKSEITRKLDEIVDFSGCERYIDTPVKRYSSGMMVRLGFAVAAHLDPEILVVDEVLAVGDAEFQKKAIGKMQDVSRGEGRTVLFVSHNMGSATGTPSFLVEVIKHCDYPLDRLTTEQKSAADLDAIDAMYSDPIPLFFQSGYLTITGFNPEFSTYLLDFPNREVEQGFVRFMSVYYHGGNRNGVFNIVNFVESVRNGDPEQFMTILQSFYADGDYQLTGKLEVYFQNSLLVLFKLMGFYVQMERHTSKGRMDVTLQTKDYIYILELKVDKSAEEALQQIEDKQYAAPFASDPRKLFKIGVCFSSEERGISEWKVESGKWRVESGTPKG